MVREGPNQQVKNHTDLSLRNLNVTVAKADKFIFNNMRKDKTYELRIDEDDDISGIDSISLVDEPAIEVNWVAFNKHKHSATEQCFHIPDGQDKSYLEKFTDRGQSEEELLSNGWEVYEEQEKFLSSSPNAPSFEDTDDFLYRYKYVLNPDAPGSPIKETTRDFCRELLNKNFVYRVEDLDNIINDEGDSALVWRGGYNCRHSWKLLKYRRGTDIVNKGSITKGRVDGVEIYDVIGYPQPDTRTSNPSFSKEKFQEGCPISTQDVETNLKNRQRAIDEAHYGPLNPNEPNEDYWKAKAKMFGGDVEAAKKARCGNCVFFIQTEKILDCISEGIDDENQLEVVKAANIGYCEAFDFKCAGARTCDAWVVGGPIVDEDMGYDVGGLPSYVDQVSGKTIEKSIAFESYNDYPESAKNNACKVLRWRDEHGDEVQGMTQVGWTRANQLCKGENISEETIARMASFARHRQNAEVSAEFKSTPWKDKGYVAWLGWGGTTGIEWAQRKLESIRNNMSKQKFQTDDEKKMVVGPAMIPDLKIFRKDMFGNPYYVFFSAETIKMIAEKYMRNKYIDNNDTNHDGKAVSDVYVVESWIKEDKEDKSNKYGYNDLPVGTWFVSMKVRNDEVWKKVKNGELKGFSVSGFFEEIADFAKEHMFLQEVVKILNKYK